MNENVKSLLVLGASSEVGMALITKVADEYDFILAHYRNSSKTLDELKETLGDKLILLQADFINEESTCNFVHKISQTGMIPTHIVHLSALNANQTKFHKSNWDNFQGAIDCSLRSLVLILQSILPQMVKRKNGKVVIMLTSYTMNLPPKFLSEYITVKYALLGLMKVLATEYAGKGITFNGVSPEMIETKFLENIPEFVVQQNASNNPLGRNLTVNDVVPTIKFLLSDGADFITGQNLGLTGGR